MSVFVKNEEEIKGMNIKGSEQTYKSMFVAKIALVGVVNKIEYDEKREFIIGVDISLVNEKTGEIDKENKKFKCHIERFDNSDFLKENGLCLFTGRIDGGINENGDVICDENIMDVPYYEQFSCKDLKDDIWTKLKNFDFKKQFVNDVSKETIDNKVLTEEIYDEIRWYELNVSTWQLNQVVKTMIKLQNENMRLLKETNRNLDFACKHYLSKDANTLNVLGIKLNETMGKTAQTFSNTKSTINNLNEIVTYPIELEFNEKDKNKKDELER